MGQLTREGEGINGGVGNDCKTTIKKGAIGFLVQDRSLPFHGCLIRVLACTEFKQIDYSALADAPDACGCPFAADFASEKSARE